ncbi:MAG: DUF4827 domain-containing protein [Bacteroidales bacterium]|nr:DUF4827 domain-containing protein [Bacteroidales bacterium]
MNKLKTIILTLTGLVLMLSACHDSKSYSELLREEERAVNWYMSNHRVVNEVPADTVFETGKDAPFYKLDEEGNLYMQVVSAGTPGNKAKYDQQIYFRYMRENIIAMQMGYNWPAEGNADDVGNNSRWFRFNNMYIKNSQQYGMGIQTPLRYLPIDCEVNLVVRAYYGFSGEQGTCQPYVYNLRYYPAIY